MNIDVEWTYRWLGPRVARRLATLGSPADARLRFGVRRRLDTLIRALFISHGPQGILARTWATGSMVLWVAILLAVYLVFYYA